MQRGIRHRRHRRVGALAFAGMVAAAAATLSAAEYRAFWVDAWGAGFRSQSEVETLLGRVGDANSRGRIRDANCNAVIVQVRRRADVCYPSAMGEPYFSGLSPSNFNALQAMINSAHDTTGGKSRVEVHCWLVTFATSSGGTPSPVWFAHRDTPDTSDPLVLDNYWPTRDDSGAETSDAAIDPGHPNVEQYLADVCMDLVTNFDIDGVHYDYIRFTGSNQGYNPTSVARYNRRYGLSGQPSPSSEQFKQWRRDQVTALVRKVYANIQAVKPWVLQSGSFVTWNPSPTSSTRSAFQATRPYYDVYSDWDNWVQEGIVDFAVPMTYYNWASLPNDYTRWMNFEKDRKGNRHMVIGPGVYLNSLSNAILELNMTRDPSPAGNYAHGFSGYSYRVPYSGGTWSNFAPSLVTNVTPTPDTIPLRPWKTSPTKGHIKGTVTYASNGKWVDGATITLTGPESRTMRCDGTGFYAFIDLTPGLYNVTASQSGYPDQSANVNVAVGAVTGNMYTQNFALSGTAPPVISIVQATNVTDHAATITWTTDTPASSRVEYGTTTGYGTLSPLDPALVTSHAVAIGSLSPNTLYHYRVISANANGSSTSGDFTFTTSGPPQITNVQATNVTSASATITWTTNAPADSQVKYGLDANYGSETGIDPANVTSHSVTIGGLSPSTQYHYQALSSNAYGSAQSGDFTFTTTAFNTEIVIDNLDPGWSNTSPSGSWTSGSNPAVPKIGSDYLYTAGAGSATRVCRWTPNIEVAGLYDVYVYYQIGANRTSAAPYQVVYDGGQVTSVQNQYSSTPNQGGWFLIGQGLPFAVGQGGYVQLSNNTGDTALVSADAAKFVYTSDAQPPTVPTGVIASAVSTTSIQLNWTASTDNTAVAGYKVFRDGGLLGSSPTNSFLDATGLSPNTVYSYEVSAYDAVPNESANSTPPVARATLSTPPSGATITCNRAAGTPYDTDGFAFTAVGDFGPGTVAKYRYAWNGSASYAWGSGAESDWASGTLALNAGSPGSFYLHVKGYNADGVANGTADFGPYVLQTPPPGKATSPSPADLATGTAQSLTLSWTAGSGASSHDVYFGLTAPGSFRGNQATTTFDTGPLLPGTTYYWRVDEVDNGVTTTGDVWQFTTQAAIVQSDIDNDGDVDLADFAAFQYCFNGPGMPLPSVDCLIVDLDHDNDVDVGDFLLFQSCFNGAANPPACL